MTRVMIDHSVSVTAVSRLHNDNDNVTNLNLEKLTLHTDAYLPENSPNVRKYCVGLLSPNCPTSMHSPSQC